MLSAEENVEYPLLQFKELERDERRARVARVSRRRAARQVRAPSAVGAERRTAPAGRDRARRSATQPKIILADEPTANLDSRTGAGILELMKEINRSFQTTFVFSTHDKKVIAKADRLVRIEDGRIRRLGMRTDDGWVLVKERRRAPQCRGGTHGGG